MSSKELLFQLYKKFYEQRSVLSGAPALTVDVEHQTADNFDINQADAELTAVISYMLGTKDIKLLPWNDALALVEKYYANQAEWQKLLLDYFSYTLEKEKENVKEEQMNFFRGVLDQLKSEQSEENKEVSNTSQ